MASDGASGEASGGAYLEEIVCSVADQGWEKRRRQGRWFVGKRPHLNTKEAQLMSGILLLNSLPTYDERRIQALPLEVRNKISITQIRKDRKRTVQCTVSEILDLAA